MAIWPAQKWVVDKKGTWRAWGSGVMDFRAEFVPVPTICWNRQLSLRP